MSSEFGLKELYDLTLKTTYPIEMEGRVFETGEVIARFDKIQLANFREIASRANATGGKGNASHVFWEDSKEVQLNFTQGIFSKRQFALMSNADLICSTPEDKVLLSTRESCESDEEGRLYLGKTDVANVFVYDAKTFEKLKILAKDFKKGIIIINKPYCDVDVDYQYYYTSGYTNMKLGQKLIQGFLQLEGKSRVKDDITGKTHTVLLRIPRLKLVSDLSMRLGREAGPLLANFAAVAYPEGLGRDKKIMELLFLNDDIDAEM